MSDVLWGVGALAVMAGCAWLGFRIEPHWVSKDGERFLCTGQVLDRTGDPLTRWRETRVAIGRHDELIVDVKRFLRRRTTTFWTLLAEGDSPPRKKVVFVAERHVDQGGTELLSLRLPSSSRAVATLRRVLDAR